MKEGTEWIHRSQSLALCHSCYNQGNRKGIKHWHFRVAGLIMKMPNRAACPAGGHLGSAQILLGRRNHHLPRVASFLLLHQSTYYKDLLPPSLPSSIDGQLGCFHLWSVLNNATMNIRLQVFVWTWFFFFLFVTYLRVQLSGQMHRAFLCWVKVWVFITFTLGLSPDFRLSIVVSMFFNFQRRNFLCSFHHSIVKMRLKEMQTLKSYCLLWCTKHLLFVPYLRLCHQQWGTSGR